ncbi:MAG: cation diffusion facilitator family transporter [Gemmatimonadota bacterium]|nr:cation diffusion facilitator family transporter [Gemmatimonadota bacterium]
MHHDHDHGHVGDHGHMHGSGHTLQRGEISRRLVWVLGLTAVFTVAEVVGGVLSNSLALLADAGHMFTDVAALALSVFAMRLAKRPPTQRRTYGYARFEILAALVNGAALLLIAGLIIVEAWQRLRDPVVIDGVVMLSVATVGLLVNVVGAVLLHSHAHTNLNVRGAYLHVLGDLLGSVGAIVAGLLVLGLGWTMADPIISVVIALLILYSAWNLVREATDVLLESAPAHLDMPRIVDELGSIDGLDDVHDLHVWTLTSGFVALSGHGVIDDPNDHMRILGQIRERMSRSGIEHVTFQLELRTLYQLTDETR